jgi:hypothetical protein
MLGIPAKPIFEEPLAHVLGEFGVVYWRAVTLHPLRAGLTPRGTTRNLIVPECIVDPIIFWEKS